MDPSLTQQYKAFKGRSIAMPAVEQRLERQRPFEKKQPAKKSTSKPSMSSFLPTRISTMDSYLSPQPQNKHKFYLLTQIVNHMKSRHQKDFSHALTLDEILEETRLNETANSTQKNWLRNEALRSNPKIKVHEDSSGLLKFTFKPKYNIKNKKMLIHLLDQHDQRGLGGILVEDILEGLPKAKKRLKSLKDRIIFVQGADKKEVAFINDQSCDFKVDEENQKLWREVAVDMLEENKIEEYLNDHGLATINSQVAVKAAPQKRRKPNRKRKFKQHNDHVTDLLVDYSEIKK